MVALNVCLLENHAESTLAIASPNRKLRPVGVWAATRGLFVSCWSGCPVSAYLASCRSVCSISSSYGHVKSHVYLANVRQHVVNRYAARHGREGHAMPLLLAWMLVSMMHWGFVISCRPESRA